MTIRKSTLKTTCIMCSEPLPAHPSTGIRGPQRACCSDTCTEQWRKSKAVARYQKDRLRITARLRLKWGKDPEANRAYQRNRWAKHRDAISAKRKAEYLVDSERQRERALAYYVKNKELIRSRRRKYVVENRARCREQERKHKATRRALHLGAFVETVDPLVVYERDRGVCGICCKQIAHGQEWHVDHVEPLSNGGAHSYDNVQLAHASCNRSKGAKISRGQGLLFRRAG